MTDDRSLERAARTFIEAGPTRAPEAAVESALLLIQTTRQERDLRILRRVPQMTIPARVATAAVFGVLAIGGTFYAFNTGSQSGVGAPRSTPSPTPSPSPKVVTADVPLSAGRYVEVPFAPGGMDLCYGQVGCTEDPADDTMRVTFTVPDGWIGGSSHTIFAAEGKAPPNGAGLVISRGGGLYGEPCGDQPPPNIPVGPSVDDFVSALVAHPKLDVTSPVDVAVAGYAGKYLDLQIPSDLSACTNSYFPWEPGIYAQGPSGRWHLSVLDVRGIRVVVQTTDYDGTSARRQAELKAIVESMQIEP